MFSHALLGQASQIQLADEATRLAAEALYEDDVPSAVAAVQRYLFEQRRVVVLESGKSLHTQVEFSPDGKHFVLSGTDVEAKLYRADGSLRHGRLCKSGRQAQPVSFAPERPMLALAADREVCFYDLAGEAVREVRRLHFEGRVRVVSYSPDGKSVLVAAGPHAWLLDSVTYQQKRVGGASWQSCAWLPDGRVIAGGRFWKDGVSAQIPSLAEC